jgi:hypothetical protein
VDAVKKIAEAVLYEGYLLWPYRKSARKNQQRWTFGGVYPRAYSEARGEDDPWIVQTQCLVLGDGEPAVEIKRPDQALEHVGEHRRGGLGLRAHSFAQDHELVEAQRPRDLGAGPPRDDVRLDPVLRVLCDERLVECLHPELRDRIREDVRSRAQAGDGADVDDGAASSGTHAGEHRARTEEGAAEVYAQDTVELLCAVTGHVGRTAGGDTSVVHQDVDRSPTLFGTGDNRVDLRLDGNVCRPRNHALAARIELGRESLEVCFGSRYERQAEALRSKLTADGRADSASCARDQGNPALVHTPRELFGEESTRCLSPQLPTRGHEG